MMAKNQGCDFSVKQLEIKNSFGSNFCPEISYVASVMVMLWLVWRKIRSFPKELAVGK